MTTNATEFSFNTTVVPSNCLILGQQTPLSGTNADSIITLQTVRVVWDVMAMIVLPLTFLMGVPANVINMVVFYRQGLKERINVCLFALSLADGLHLVTNVLLHGDRFYTYFVSKQISGPLTLWITNHNMIWFCSFVWVSQVLTAIVASERCFCVLRPLQSQAVLRTSTMASIIVAVFIVVLGFRAIVTTRFYNVCAYDPVSGKTFRHSTVTEFYKRNKKLVDFLDVFVYGLVLPWVVIVVIVTTTVTTVIKLRQAAERRADMSSNSGTVSARDIGVTRMLVGNSIFFIVCIIPGALFRFTLLFIPELNSGRRYSNTFFTGLFVLNMISYVNATFNFVVYYTMGSRYRQTFWTLLGRKSTKDTL